MCCELQIGISEAKISVPVGKWNLRQDCEQKKEIKRERINGIEMWTRKYIRVVDKVRVSAQKKMLSEKKCETSHEACSLFRAD